MNESKTIRRRFNIFDAAILALVLAVIAGAMLLRDRSTGGPAARETGPIRFTVELTKAPAGIAEQMTVGKDVFRSTDGAYIGKVAEVRCVPHEANEYSPAAGTFVRYPYQESYDVYLTVEGQGYTTARDVVVGDVAPKTCGEMAVKGKGFARLGYVVNIDLMDTEPAKNDAVGTGEREATYVIRLAEMRDMLLDCVHAGDRLYEKLSGALLGEVTDVWTEPYGETHLDAAGQPVYMEKAGVWNIFIRVRGNAVEKNDGYYLDGGTELKIGADVTVSSQYLERTGVFFALEELR